MNGTLSTYENSDMSLSCHGSILIEDGVVKDLSFKGCPRANGIDGWTAFYKRKNIGDVVTEKEIKNMLKFNGANNIISKFTENN